MCIKAFVCSRYIMKCVFIRCMDEENRSLLEHHAAYVQCIVYTITLDAPMLTAMIE